MTWKTLFYFLFAINGLQIFVAGLAGFANSTTSSSGFSRLGENLLFIMVTAVGAFTVVISILVYIRSLRLGLKIDELEKDLEDYEARMSRR